MMASKRRSAVAVLIVCLLAVLQPAASQSAYQPAFGRQLSCKDWQTRLLGKVLTIRPENLCSSFGLGRPSLLGCTLLDVVDDVLERANGKCQYHQQVMPKSVGADGQPIPAPLEDKRPLPARSFGDEKALLGHEGGTMYWFITSLVNMELWVTCKNNASFDKPWLIPSGWNLLKLQTTYEGSGRPMLPMSAILRNDAAGGKHMAVIVRGTRTPEEWREDLTYLQIQDSAYPGMISKGFKDATEYLWDGVQQALQEHVVAGAVTHVTIGGHSLGSAIATLMAYRMQVFLDSVLKKSKKVTVGAVLFAPPNVGDATFVSHFNQMVNARRVAFSLDIVPQVPCSPYMMACQSSTIATYSPGITSWNYEPVGGHVTIHPAGMPVQSEVWQRLSTVNGCQLMDWTQASHVCSYPCWFSKFANDSGRGRCKLWGAQAASEVAPDGSYCPGFPVHSPEFPLDQGSSKVVYGGNK